MLTVRHTGVIDSVDLADIEITVYVSLGDDQQVSEAMKAAKILESMGFVVVIVPVTVGWDIVSHDIGHDSTPAVQVNGVLVSEGRLVKAEEIVAEALSLTYKGGSEGPMMKGSKGGDGEVSVSVAA